MLPMNQAYQFGGGACYIPPDQGYGYPLQPQSSYSEPLSPQAYLFYKLMVSDQLWLHERRVKATEVIKNVCIGKCKDFTAGKLVKRDGCYCKKERNGREVEIGNLRIKDKFIVNQKEDGTFDAVYFKIEYNGSSEAVAVAIPYRNFVKRNILQYLPFLNRNEDCPDTYLVQAFYKEFADGDDIKFLLLPTHSGFQPPKDGRTSFASAGIVIPQLHSYYTKDILLRKVVHTEKQFAEAANSLAKVHPSYWKYKFLLVIRVTSILLFFYGLEGLFPDHMFVIEPKSEPNAKTTAVFLNNKSPGLKLCSLTACKTELLNELHGINDGMSIFRDTSYVEEEKKRNESLNLLHKELHSNNSSSSNRTLTAIITDSLGHFSSEFSAYMLSLNDCPDVEDNAILQNKLFKLDAALIKLLSNSDVSENLVTNTLKNIREIDKINFKPEYAMSQKMLLSTMKILKECGLINDYEADKIEKYIYSSNEHESVSTNVDIVNEFSNDLSNRILAGNAKIYNQFDPPYFNPDGNSIVYDGKFINIKKSFLDRIVIGMGYTKSRNKVLKALSDCGKLHATKSYKRDIDIAVAPGTNRMFSVYSFPKSILSPKCVRKLEEVSYTNFLFSLENLPPNFIPLICLPDSKKIAGCVIDETTDEEFNMIVIGQPRRGKTTYQANQAVARAKAGESVIIFDQTNAFSPEELKKFLPPEIVKEYFTHWEIGKYGIPINLLSPEHCTSLPDMKKHLFSIFSIAAEVTGKVQSKVLKNVITQIAEAVKAEEVHTLPETLKFFNINDTDQKELHDRLETVFNDLKGLNNYEQNIGEFLNSQKKIVVISDSNDSIKKSNLLVDMMLAYLYEYKQYDEKSRYTVILDEIKDLCLEKDGPISILLRKGAKKRVTMILASHEYSLDKDKLGTLIGYCSYHVFFRPKDENLNDIAKHINVEKSVLVNLEQGHCIIVGPLFNTITNKNKQMTIIGWTYIYDNE